jgi:hypothetical protein
MELAVQLMMGVSLAACAGLRAWLPILCVGLLAKTGYLVLHPTFVFLTRTDLLMIFGVATALELLGDKIPALDNFLDSIGTIARPLAGAMLTASVITQTDPAMAMVLGLIIGGGTAFTIHTGKALTRVQSTALVPAHGGLGNMALSFGEDIASIGGIGLAVWLPIVAFILAAVALYLCIRTIRSAIQHGRKLLSRMRGRHASEKDEVSKPR